MELEDILKQQVEISELFDHLAQLHKFALLGQAEKTEEQNHIEISKSHISLTDIRHDITVCLNDFNVLNNMLISYDGKIKEQLNTLQQAKDHINDMKLERTRIRQQQQEWSGENRENVSDSVSDIGKDEMIEIKTSYKYKMNKYIELIGINNTRLATQPDSTEANPDIIKDEPGNILTGRKTTRALSLLDESFQEIQNEITSLNSLITSLKRDATFIANERKDRISYMKLQQRKFDNELSQVEKNIKRQLTICGLQLPSNDNIPISQRILHLSFYQDDEQIKKLEQESEDIIEHSDEFIDLKIKELKDQLTHRKYNSPKLLADRNLWQDCVTNLEELEDFINQAIGRDTPISSSKLIQKIKIKIGYLESLLTFTENEKIKSLINYEIYSLKMACKELSPPNSPKFPETNGNIQIHTQKYTNFNIDETNNKTSSSHINHIAPNISPFVVGKSPPKIGLSHESSNYTLHSIDKKTE